MKGITKRDVNLIMKRRNRVLIGIGATLLIGVLAAGGYVAYQYHKGMQLAEDYAQKTWEENSYTPGSSVNTNSGSGNNNAWSAGENDIPGLSAASGGSSPASGSSSSSSSAYSTPPDPAYRASMTDTYQNVLQTMENIKANTYSLQKGKMSLSSYKASIRDSQAAFSQALDYSKAHPPQNAASNIAYQDFVSAIDLSNQAMTVVLNGIAALDPSSLFAARSMGSTAKDRLISGYNHL